jgi:hypothetical protein
MHSTKDAAKQRSSSLLKMMKDTGAPPVCMDADAPGGKRSGGRQLKRTAFEAHYFTRGAAMFMML